MLESSAILNLVRRSKTESQATKFLAQRCAEKRSMPFIRRLGNRCLLCGSQENTYAYRDLVHGIHLGHPEERKDKYKDSLGPMTASVCRECLVNHLSKSWPGSPALKSLQLNS